MFIVTGAAGFIGSSLCDRLLSMGHRVLGIDNLSTGRKEFLESASESDKFTLVQGDITNLSALSEIFSVGAEAVFHLAANADIRFGVDNPRKDLEQNTIGTFNVLEAMRVNGIKKILFSSTGSVQGEANVIPTPENAPFPVQTSFYAASKASGEGVISAYCEAFNFQSWIFRFVSILGERYTHGHVFDFYKKLQQNSEKLEVLGNGLQRKSYLYVQDCIDAIMIAFSKASEKVNIFNLGLDDSCEVRQSIGWICEQLNVNPKLEYAGGERGWVGDNPLIHLDISKIRSLGWVPKHSIREGVHKTLDFLKKNDWVLSARGSR